MSGTSEPEPGAASLGSSADWMSVGAFSEAAPGAPLPGAWQDWPIGPHKRRTRYQLVESDGRTVLQALADRSASGLTAKLGIDPLQYPVIEFSWRVGRLIPGADVGDRHAEDAPARVILAFDGDVASLPVADRMLFERARLLTGRDMPYATLMYVWENRQPVEAIIPNPHTGRIRKIVVASGEERVGAWREFRRNVVEDYRRAFGAEPGRLLAIGLMTDTDNTGEQAEALYGDIRLRRP